MGTERIAVILKSHGFRLGSSATHGAVVWSRGEGLGRTVVELPVKSVFDDEDIDSVVGQSGIARDQFCASFDPSEWGMRFDAYEAWLHGFSPKRARQFRNDALTNPDGAAVELRTREMLLEAGLEVLPNCDPNGGSDFMCKGPIGEFEVEATAIRVETLMDKMALADVPAGPSSYGGPWLMIKSKVADPQKVLQFEKASRPLLLVLGTEHRTGGILGMDPLFIEWAYVEPEDPRSMFLVRDQASGYERSCLLGLSAIMLLASESVIARGPSAFSTIGMLNPGASRRFPTELLGSHSFCNYLGHRSQDGPVCEWLTGNPARCVPRNSVRS